MPHLIGLALAAGAALTLAGCDGAPKAADNSIVEAARPLDTATTAPIEPAPAPSATPTASTSAEPDRGAPEAAVAVVDRYYDAINRGDFRTAYTQWDRDGAASNQSFAQFKRGFAETATTSAEAGAPTNGDAGAGSVFVDVPVIVHAQLKDGTQQRFTGRYTLRRVNDVDGATAEQLRWHLDSAVLKAD